jgi:hypothetical protein
MKCLDSTRTLKRGDYLICIRSSFSNRVVPGGKYRVAEVHKRSFLLEFVPLAIMAWEFDIFVKLDDMTAYDKLIYNVDIPSK